MKNRFAKILDKINFLDQEKRFRFQLIIVSLVFFLAGAVFTIINFLNKSTYTLGIVTATFCFLSLLTFFLTIVLKKGRTFIELLFVLSAIIMFLYFLIFGGAGERGFSTYWILLLPFLSMMVLGRLKGSIATITMFLMIAFFLWVPFGRAQIQWKMEDVFIVRFPLIYLAAFAASYLFELSRSITDKHAEGLRHQLELTATHDYLTNLTNRAGFAKLIESQKLKVGTPEFTIASAMLIDVDDFKHANDAYGHAFGDEVLISIANILKEHAGENAIRFGGDEFICLFENKNDFELRQIAEDIRAKVANIKYEKHPEYHITVSIGIAESKVDENYRVERVIELADYQSSQAKKAGKNTIYLISYDKLLGKQNKNSTSIYDTLQTK